MLQLLHDTCPMLCVMLCDVWQSGILNVFLWNVTWDVCNFCVISVTSTSHHSSHHSKLNVWPGFCNKPFCVTYDILCVTCDLCYVMLLSMRKQVTKSFVRDFLFHFRLRFEFFKSLKGTTDFFSKTEHARSYILVK